ncbi:unnamed protein product [Protopolystoma xenopodis]|uniref:Uncharacterized protein n=1 Tax=Protopolystoma xenopodis TaxID=117903 RepID=A0A448XRA4_9PLAT|nr:unnamed protein product [Protopolystoma xenopodis]
MKGNALKSPMNASHMNAKRQNRVYRYSGNELPPLLLYNGLTLELRIRGDLKQRYPSQPDTVVSAVLQANSQRSSSPTTNSSVAGVSSVDSFSALPSSSLLTRHTSVDQQHESQAAEASTRSQQYQQHISLLSKPVRIQHHEMLTETICQIELEPIKPSGESYAMIRTEAK